MEFIDFVALVNDVKECCEFRRGFCKNCPYQHMPPAVCGLKFLTETDLQSILNVCDTREVVLKCVKFGGELRARKSCINRDFEAELWTIKKSIDELCKNVDVYINGRKNEQSC